MTTVSATKAALDSLKKASTNQDYGNLKRFGITTDKAFGASMANIQKIAKPLGKNHELAAAPWKTGWYEARMLASFVDDPAARWIGRDTLRDLDRHR